jgi:hypothetical protein
VNQSRLKLIAAAGLLMAMVGCASEDPGVQSRQEKLVNEGFASPIPLPPLADIDERVCIEEILRTGRNRPLAFNGNSVVDLGIFHIHDGVEHTNTAESCSYCSGERREGHIVLGQEPCRRSVVRRPWPDTAQGRKDRADALLGECGEVVLSVGVCLDGRSRRVALDSERTWDEAREQLMCINLGGPTGAHSPHQAMVQWIHLRESCPRLSGQAALHSSSFEPGKLHVGMAADIVDVELQDAPRCGTMSYRSCRVCGTRHARCCGPTDPGYSDGSDGCEEGLTCEGSDGYKRCLPHAPAGEHE